MARLPDFPPRERLGVDMETKTPPNGAKRAQALTVVIDMIRARYQNAHCKNQDGRILELLDKAAAVVRANDDESLTEAIRNI